jgi:mutator protein MutT
VIRVVAGVIWNQEGEILIGQRQASCRHLANKWEFPGGKQESGETPEGALIRELQEELGIQVGEIKFFMDVKWQYSSTLIHMLAYSVRWVGGTPQPLAHQELAWVNPKSLSQYDFAPADWELVFNLDPHYEITVPQSSFPLPEPHS